MPPNSRWGGDHPHFKKKYFELQSQKASELKTVAELGFAPKSTNSLHGVLPTSPIPAMESTSHPSKGHVAPSKYWGGHCFLGLSYASWCIW